MGNRSPRVQSATGKAGSRRQFSDYFDFAEKLAKVPSHRILALFRAEKEEILDVAVEPEDPATASGGSSPYELRIMHRFGISDRGRPGDKWLMDTARWAWRTKIHVHLGIDLRMRLWNAAEQKRLDAVVEDCVNAVGVDANTASAPLLARVSGIGAALAQDLILHRDANGPFRSRKSLKNVPRLGPKAFEQYAGFLRIPGGEDPLDTSDVHPEAYPVVRRIIEAARTDIKGLIGNATVLRALSPKNFVDDTFGLPTVTDILRELEKPGRDPRPAFKAAVFMDGVETLNDLKPGMVLEGAVTNVAAFGAFVDIGVHQDGLVHVSAMSKTFVKDPREVVKPGDIVRVKVLEVDIPRKRVALTLRLDDELGPTDRAGTAAPRNDSVRPASRRPSRSAAPTRREEQGGGALADALRRAGLAEKRK